MADKTHSTAAATGPPALREILPRTGLVYSDKSTMIEILSKPKLMAIKSSALEKLEKIGKEAKIAAHVSAAAQTAATTVALEQQRQQQAMQQQQMQQQQQQQQQVSSHRPVSAAGRPASATGNRLRQQQAQQASQLPQ